MSKDQIDIDKLRWVRLLTPSLIPRYLIDQVKLKDYTTDDFFKYQEINCLIQDENGITPNPFNHLYGLVDDHHFVKGMLWCVIDPLSKNMVINTYSVDSAIWAHNPTKNKAVTKLVEFIKTLMKKMKISKVYWITGYPKHSQKHGFSESRNVLMEYNLDEKEDSRNPLNEEEKNDG